MAKRKILKRLNKIDPYLTSQAAERNIAADTDTADFGEVRLK